MVKQWPDMEGEVTNNMYVTRSGVIKEKPKAEKLNIDLGFDTFPRENTCDGDNQSPRIKIEGGKTPYLALIMDDPDAEKGRFAHWILWDLEMTHEIPAKIPKNDEIREPVRVTQGRNSAGKPGYTGPCPPRGTVHRYFVKVYGYHGEIGLKATANVYDLENALENRYKQFGQTMARYARPV